jgi:hypothetical protein
MASLKGERARVGVVPQKTQPRPVSIKPAAKAVKFTGVTSERVKKTALGAGVAVSLALLLSDGDTFTKGGAWGVAQSLAGLLCLVLLPLFVLYRDIKRYKVKISGNMRKMMLISLILVGSTAISRLSLDMFTTFTATLAADGARTGYFAVPAAAGAMLATLLFDIHIGIVFSFIVSVLMGILLPAEPLFFLYAFVGSMTAAFSVIRCTQRSALMKAGLFVGLANVATVVFMDLYRHQLFMASGWHNVVAAFLGGILAGVLVSGILPLLEWMFKEVTDISLLEYADLNRPLLKSLMVAAPGTYHHSIIIGSLAEGAAEAVGVNPLMARVSAYYHDIGKIKKPEYFIENQAKGENRHDRLTPSMSSLIIASHVKDGVELAHEHNLPPIITDIIQQHHGTALMTYFYSKAKEAEGESSMIREEEYRYPGPKPQTKVAAIVMLADAVEAASRVLDNPTPSRIAALTDKIVTRIFEDGQLSECDLTLRDLTEIMKSFSKLLGGIYHYRIDYPGLGIPSGGERRRVGGPADKLPAEHKGPRFEVKEGSRGGTVVIGVPRR